MVDENVNEKWLEEWQSGESGVDNVKDGASDEVADALSLTNKLPPLTGE